MGIVRRVVIAVVAAACVASLGPGTPSPPATEPAAAGTLPPAFVETTVISGLSQPTAVRFASDGRVFVAEKSGVIKVFASVHSPTPTVFADLRTNVHNYWDRGLLGLALDPGFPAVPYVYVLYTYDHVLGDPTAPPKWGSAGVTADPCPTPPGPLLNGCVVSGRLSRLQAAGSVMTGSEHVLVEDWCQQFRSHTVGDLAFGPDGMLYVSAGDGAEYTTPDFGKGGNPCGDPGGPSPTPPTAEGGALRSQDLLTRDDPVGLSGSVIRVNPATGEAAAGNPLGSDPDPNARRIVASGLRNPYRVAFRPGTPELWLADVGQSTWEEINRISSPTAAAVNFGWPCYEGAGQQSLYAPLGLTLCETLYASPGATTLPYFAYGRAVAAEAPCQGRPAVTGLAFEFAPTGGMFPPEYTGALFFADYSQKCLWVMRRGPDGVPGPALVEPFLTGAAGPVDLRFGPDGSLYYTDIGGGTIRRISPSSPAAPIPDYASGSDYPTGSNAHGIAVADLTSDGKPDLVVANAGSGSVSVMRGNGDGTFGAATSFGVGSQPKSVAAADLDGDGKIDLVTANQGSNSVSILRGDGTGSFSPSGDYPVCSGAHEVAIGQFDDDAAPDLAVACWGGSVIGVLLGKGGATFGAATSFPAGTAPHSIVAHDFDGDGRHDLAVANHGSDTVGILSGTGAGAFAAPVHHSVGQGPHSIRTGDFDSDGVTDLVTANDGSSTVTVLRGAADGTFPSITDYPTGSVPKGVAVGDLNGDGALDVVTANTAGRYPSGGSAPGGNQVSMLFGSESGTLSAPHAVVTGDTPFSVVIARLDDDGRPDLATANWFGNGLSVLLTGGPPPSVPAAPAATTGPLPAVDVVPATVTNAAAVTKAATGSKPRNRKAPSISGVARVGRVLTARDGAWSGTPAPRLSRRWLRCRSGSVASCVAITGATSRTYRTRQADLGARLRIRVTARNATASVTANSRPTSKIGRRRGG